MLDPDIIIVTLRRVAILPYRELIDDVAYDPTRCCNETVRLAV